MNSRKIIFDVGCNDGRTFKEAIHYGHTVYAFEPHPILASKVLNWINELDIKNYYLSQQAVSLVDGFIEFNLSLTDDMGCSSLKKYNEKPHNGYFQPFSDTILVSSIRMDTFIKQHKINKIDYLHIDAQGSDLEVLESFGENLDVVVEGVIEVPNLVTLYENTKTKEQSIDWLIANNFQIICIENDETDNEQNIYFRNKIYGEAKDPWVKSGTSLWSFHQ